MKKMFLLIAFNFIVIFAFSQKLKDGNYLFRFNDDEYGKFNGTCNVIIKADSIYVYAKEDCHRSPGELIIKGLLLKHITGKWIIGKNKNDIKALDIGGCSEGPAVIDLKKKIFHYC